MFKALLVDKHEAGMSVRIEEMTHDRLPEADVTVRVEWSTVNYKDALALTGSGPIIRRFPMVPGIDFAGEVATSQSPQFKPGDKVILNGWGVGEHHWGGLAEFARVRSEWLIPLPAALTTRQAMAIGTAGYTAMLCIMALERAGVESETGPVLVTGASGGVGSIALILLSHLGYRAVAVTGRPSEQDYLRKLGAAEIIDRQSFAETGRPLEKAIWAGAIDVAGGPLLASICAAIQPRGAVAACGLAGGMALPLTVAPFILRGVSLLGIDSVNCPRAERTEAWSRLARSLDFKLLEEAINEIPLSSAVQAAQALLDGQRRGRTLVNIMQRE